MTKKPVALIFAFWVVFSLAGYWGTARAEVMPDVEEKVRSLVGRLGDKDYRVANPATDELVAMQAESFPVLAEMLSKDEDTALVGKVISMMQGSDKRVQAIRPNLNNQSPKVRAEAVRILMDWNDSGSFKLVEKLINDKDNDVRIMALRAYGRLGRDYDKRMLAGLLKDENDTIREDASGLMSRGASLSSADIEGPLLEAVNDRNIRVRQNALYALGANRLSGGIVVLIEALSDPDDDTHAHALSGLRELKAVEAYPYIMKPFEERKEMSDPLISDSARALIGLGKPVDLKLFYPYLLKTQDYDAGYNLLTLIKTYAKASDKDEAMAVVKQIVESKQYMLTEYAKEVYSYLEKL